MDPQNITESLNKCFHTENYRIVFWYDPDQEFLDIIPSLTLDGVTYINMEQESLLELKVRLELQDQQGKYLLYSPKAEPKPDNDWLLDIKLYSRQFHADRASILKDELGLTTHSMREHLNKRKRFLASKDRVAKLKKFLQAEDGEKQFDLSILAALTKADQASVFDILMKLFGDMCDANSCDYKSIPSLWGEIDKYDMAPFFWGQMEAAFGYTTDAPSLTDLLIRLLVNDFDNTAKGELPGSLAHFLFANKAMATNASVFAAQWRNHMHHTRQYSLISREVATDLRLDELLAEKNEDALIDCMTFEAVERQIIRSLRNKIMQETLEKPENLKPTIIRRRDGHWTKVALQEYGDNGNIYATTYDALDAAIDMLILRRTHAAGFSFVSAERMYKAYTNELYRFDQLHRLFHEAADTVDLAGWDILKDVQQIVEACYNGWYLDQLATCWGEFLEGQEGLLHRWSIPNTPSQQNFFAHQAKPLLQGNPKSKVFVIISDALRYEVAEELMRDINTKNRFKATLSSQLGILPSYTALGMASLLPHTEYGYKEGTDTVLVDGKPCASLEQRSVILSDADGIAIPMDQLLSMNKEQGRELIRPWRVIYIYHDEIDSSGHTNENSVFKAARGTIDVIMKTIRIIVNNLNGTNIFVTADHGFLYQDTPPGMTDKSKLEHKPESIIKAKKRYVLGTELGNTDKAWTSNTRTTAGTTSSLDFWIPKGVNRFHFSGGARFIHGGAMPQEVIVPIVQVKELEGKAAEREAVKQVGVSLLGSTRKIVNTIQKFEFIQTEKVSARMLPRTLTISLRDGEGLISNEEALTFDSASDSMEERKRTVKLMLKKGNYDNKKEYSLVLRDPDTQIEYERFPMTIDLAFMNDF